MRDIRLGDDIDDFCVRCKRVMNHAVVSVISAAPAKVRCRTCHSDHDYRHEQAPPPKIDARKAALFHEVLKKVNPDAAAVEADLPPVPEVELEADAEALAEVDGDATAVAVVEDEAPLVEAPAVEEEILKSKAKAKAKPKVKGKR
jgi:hypothetical protein